MSSQCRVSIFATRDACPRQHPKAEDSKAEDSKAERPNWEWKDSRAGRLKGRRTQSTRLKSRNSEQAVPRRVEETATTATQVHRQLLRPKTPTTHASHLVLIIVVLIIPIPKPQTILKARVEGARKDVASLEDGSERRERHGGEAEEVVQLGRDALKDVVVVDVSGRGRAKANGNMARRSWADADTGANPARVSRDSLPAAAETPREVDVEGIAVAAWVPEIGEKDVDRTVPAIVVFNKLALGVATVPTDRVDGVAIVRDALRQVLALPLGAGALREAAEAGDRLAGGDEEVRAGDGAGDVVREEKVLRVHGSLPPGRTHGASVEGTLARTTGERRAGTRGVPRRVAIREIGGAGDNRAGDIAIGAKRVDGGAGEGDRRRVVGSDDTT